MLKVAMGQINTRIGDISYNIGLIKDYVEGAKAEGCDIICFPEMAVTGYPPCDLLYNPQFIEQAQRALEEVALIADGICILLGTVGIDLERNKLTNYCVVMRDRSIDRLLPKRYLTNYPYFDEYRYFGTEHRGIDIIKYRDVNIGIAIGDIGDEQLLDIKNVKDQIDMVINISASPYYYGRQVERIDGLSNLSQLINRPIAYVNMVGGNNELVFDGGSSVIDGDGKICARASSFRENLLIWDGDNIEDIDNTEEIGKIDEDISYIYDGIVLGLRDYCQKLGVKKVLLGLSGGIDSALAACVAADAVGNANVLAIQNHSSYTSQESRNDAEELIENLKIEERNIPIDSLFKAYIDEFNPEGQPIYDLAEENIQARIRGDIWMFISNREGHMVISGSNKSELNVGYTTLYGDMCSGLAPLSDIYKTQVYELCRYINRDREIIPESIINKPPSAELRPDQRDEDSLPPYNILDKVLYMYLEEGKFEEEIIAKGYDPEVVYRIIGMVKGSEYKRRQAAPPIRVSRGWFKRDRQMPIVHGFRVK